MRLYPARLFGAGGYRLIPAMEAIMESYTIKTRETGRWLGERTTTVKLPKRLRKVSKVTVTMPLPGTKRFVTTVIGDNNAGNRLTDVKQNKFGALAAVMFDGTNTTPDDVTGPVANGPMTADYKPFVFQPTEKQLRCGRKYGHNKSRH